MSRAWTTLRFPIGPNGVWYPLCRACDGVILIPLDPSKLAEGVPYLEGTILTGPVCQDNELVYTVDYEDTLLADPGSTLLQCDYRICCNDCSPKMVKLLSDLQNARLDDVEAQIDAITIPVPQMSVVLGQDELAEATVNNDGTLAFADPFDTYSADFESAVFNFLNPSTVRSMRVAIRARFGVSFINAHASRYQTLFMESYLKVNGVLIPLSVEQQVRTAIPASPGQTIEAYPEAVVTVPPSTSITIRAGGRTKRVSGSDPTDLTTLRIDARNVQLKQIIGVTI